MITIYPGILSTASVTFGQAVNAETLRQTTRIDVIVRDTALEDILIEVPKFLSAGRGPRGRLLSRVRNQLQSLPQAIFARCRSRPSGPRRIALGLA